MENHRKRSIQVLISLSMALLQLNGSKMGGKKKEALELSSKNWLDLAVGACV